MKHNDTTITQLTSFSLEDAEMIRKLAAELGADFKALSTRDLEEITTSPTTYLFVARESTKQKIVGMATLAIYRIPYLKKAYFDDFIVEKAYRGKGVGSQLLEKVLSSAKELGASYIDFTSNSNRLEANKLYKKLGFKKRDTNVYRLTYDYAKV